jgi:hypothetical protein
MANLLQYFWRSRSLSRSALCAAIVSLQARKDPCTIYGFFAVLFAMIVLPILSDQHNPVAITGPVLILGTYFVVQYGRAQMKRLQLDRLRHLSTPAVADWFLLTSPVARMPSLEYLAQGGFAQCRLYSFWLDISLWPFIVHLIHRMWSDSSLAPGSGQCSQQASLLALAWSGLVGRAICPEQCRSCRSRYRS